MFVQDVCAWLLAFSAKSKSVCATTNFIVTCINVHVLCCLSVEYIACALLTLEFGHHATCKCTCWD